MNDNYSKEEVDQSFVSEKGFEKRVGEYFLYMLKNEKEVERQIGEIIKEYLIKKWIFIVLFVCMSILSVSRVIEIASSLGKGN